MDMRIDMLRVRTEREQRAWSQEHLAEVSGLSLRTIQRVETTGTASYDTVRALAAVFQVPLGTLQAPAARPAPVDAPRRRWAAIAASLLLVSGAVLVREAAAGDVMLDVGVSLDDARLGDQQLAAPEGKSTEFRFEGEVRLFVNPVVTQDGSILLSMRVEAPSGSRWVEFAEPRLLVVNGNQAMVTVTSPSGKKFSIAIRPRRI